MEVHEMVQELRERVEDDVLSEWFLYFESLFFGSLICLLSTFSWRGTRCQEAF